MILYTPVDLETTPFPIKKQTIASGMDGFEVMNYSNVPLKVSSLMRGDLGEVPPLFARSFLASANEVIEFNEDASLATNALAQPTQFIEFVQTQGTQAALVPLAQVPGYEIVVNGSVNLSGGTVDATIAGTPTIQFAAGSTVSISNNSLNVTPTPGSTVEVANTIDANLTGASVTIDTNSVNSVFPSNSLISFGSKTITVTNLANGQIAYSDDNFGDMGIYDGMMVTIQSHGGFEYAIDQRGLFVIALNSSYEYALAGNPRINAMTYNGVASTGISQTFFDQPYYFNDPTFYLINNTGNTIASDTIDIFIYCVKAQISNPINNPVNTQGVQGSPTASGYTNLDSGNSWNVTFPALANTTITSLTVSGQWQGSATATDNTAIVIASNNLSGYIAFFPVTGTQPSGFWTPYTINFNEGITLGSNGINIYLTGAEYNVQVSIFATLK